MERLPDGLWQPYAPVDYRASLRLMPQADALLLIDAALSESPFFPSKLADYLGAGRPILGLTPDGTAADLLRAYGAPVAHPDDQGAVIDCLCALLWLRPHPDEEGIERKNGGRAVLFFDGSDLIPMKRELKREGAILRRYTLTLAFSLDGRRKIVCSCALCRLFSP